MTVAFTGSDGARGEELATASGATFIAWQADDRASTDQAVEQALALCGGRLDVLVTTPEMLVAGSVEATAEADFRRLVEADLTAAFRTARASWGAMRAAGGGSMINVASAAGIRAAHESAAYSIASAGLIAVSELLAAEGAPHGIRANAVCPGGGPPAGGGSEGVEDVAAVVAWLASAQSVRVSGATIRVDGGAGAAMILDTRA
jgi:NAD(P)-dependent dehydrogenase (short-subunit alcohol dehydrogenase family)